MKRLLSLCAVVLCLAAVSTGIFYLIPQNTKPSCRLIVKSDGVESATEEIDTDLEGVSQAGKLVTRLDVVEASIIFDATAAIQTLQLLDLSSGVMVSTKFDSSRTQNSARIRDVYKSLDAEIVCSR